jgi:membrane protein YqaA with SNARE-associated domain
LKLLLREIVKGLTRLSDFLVALGPFGLFAVALLDSTFVPLPSGADALVVLLSTAQPRWMPVYALLATSGSVLGCVILYLISRRAGNRALCRFSHTRQKRVKELIERYDVLSVLVASLLPPPFPFKLFVVTSGVLRFPLKRFTIAIVAGRGFRFFLEGYLAVHYGLQARLILAKYYPWIALGLAVLITAAVIGRSLLKKRREAAIEEALEVGN